MYQSAECLCCGSTDFSRYPALIAPFIASYVLDSGPSAATLLECGNCTFRFYAQRFSAAEASRLYAGYRGESYFAARNRHEFWYSRKINSDIGNDPDEITLRKERAKSFLTSHLDPARIETVLDFGGDRGQFLPDGIGKQRWVFEISDVEPLEGVSKIPSEKELDGRQFDLILLSNVLEHCSEPAEILRSIKRLAGRDGSLLFIELPYERYRLGFVPKGALYRGYLQLIARMRAVLTLLDFYSTVFRIKGNTVPPLGFLKLHEHINFFNERSLQHLLEADGFEVLGFSVTRNHRAGGFQDALLCLARAHGS